MTAAAFVVFSLAMAAMLLYGEQMFYRMPPPTGDIRNNVKLHVISGGVPRWNRYHTMTLNGLKVYEPFCNEEPFYPGMNATIDYEQRKGCMYLRYYVIERSDNEGTVATHE